MTPQRDIERVLEHWLVDGVDVMPDRTYLTILDRVERQPQQRAWRLTRSDSHMNGYLKPLAAIAAVVVIAVAGIAVFGRPSDPGVGTAPSTSPAPSGSTAPSESATPSASPSANAVFPSWFVPDDDAGAGTLSAGSHTTNVFVPGFTYTVPEGWVNGHDTVGFFSLFPDTPANAAEHAATETLANEIIMGPLESPYFLCYEWEDNTGATAAEMVTALVANDALAVSEPIDVTIGGLTGKQVDVQLDPAWTESCPSADGLDLEDMRHRGFLLDLPQGGVLVIFMKSQHAADHEAFLTEAMPIIESFQFDLTP